MFLKLYNIIETIYQSLVCSVITFEKVSEKLISRIVEVVTLKVHAVKEFAPMHGYIVAATV